MELGQQPDAPGSGRLREGSGSVKILRAKTSSLFEGRPLTGAHLANTKLNEAEMRAGATVLKSYPRRLVFELTNCCNLNCIMCGRNSANFQPTTLDIDTFCSLEPIMDHVEEVTLMGWGEPTVNPWFADMLQVIADHGARAYFCTNGMRLDALVDKILDTRVEVFAVSVDGATQESNARIRRGADLDRICESLRELFRRAQARGQEPPWVNFVLCAMRENIAELPAVVRLAHETGVREVKVVYLTAFDEAQAPGVLWGHEDEVRAGFDAAVSEAERLDVALKLPYVPGQDPAGAAPHRPCFTAWRDFFLGSDGYVRPCMSTSQKLMRYDAGADFLAMWNAPEFQRLRATVNQEGAMPPQCTRCYQSSHCNWNLRSSFLQVGEVFSPEWE